MLAQGGCGDHGLGDALAGPAARCQTLRAGHRRSGGRSSPGRRDLRCLHRPGRAGSGRRLGRRLLGFKSILDLAATLEALETRGVPIIAYRTNDLPAFFTSSSGLVLEHRVETVEAAAAVVRTHRDLGLPGAVVLANPVPAADAVDRELVEVVLDSALADARHRNTKGKAITPFLLAAIREATAGQSLRANCSLLVSNARLAAEIAVALFH